MDSIDPKIKHELDMRLAKGEIAIDEYQVLVRTIMQDDNGLSAEPTPATMSSFIIPGALKHVWNGINHKEYRLHKHYLDIPNIKNRLLWLGSDLDYFLTDEYIIILSSPNETKFKRIADTVAKAGTVGALAGGLFISLPALLVGSAYEKLFGERNQFNLEALSKLFNSGYLVYSKRTDLVFHSFTIKPGVLEWPYTIVAIIGRFECAHVGGVDLCLLLSECRVDGNIKIAKPLKAAGCLFYEHPEKLKTEDQIYSYLPPEFPKPAAAHETMCPKCIHFREQNKWQAVGLTGRFYGDCHLPSKPSNEKLPCSIPLEAAVIWDSYFAVTESNRQYLYPTNCPLFVRSGK